MSLAMSSALRASAQSLGFLMGYYDAQNSRKHLTVVSKAGDQHCTVGHKAQKGFHYINRKIESFLRNNIT